MLEKILPPLHPLMETICDLVQSEDRRTALQELGTGMLKPPYIPKSSDHKNAIGWGASSDSVGQFLAVLATLFMNPQKVVQTNGKKPVFLDLGSGTGNAGVYAARHGWQSYGIEFNTDCYLFSLENISEAEGRRTIEPGTAKIAHGNFFPEDFAVRIKRNQWVCDLFREYLDYHKNKTNGNPYAKLDLSLDQVDLFYHYQVEMKDNILRLVEQKAKPGAIVIITDVNGDIPKVGERMETIGRLDVRHHHAKMEIYRKR